jgi:hypothetical protein
MIGVEGVKRPKLDLLCRLHNAYSPIGDATQKLLSIQNAVIGVGHVVFASLRVLMIQANIVIAVGLRQRPPQSCCSTNSLEVACPQHSCGASSFVQSKLALGASILGNVRTS